MNIEALIELLHKNQTRKTGEKYTSHLYAVKNILINEGIKDQIILDAALLHDSLEDSNITKEYLAFRFGNKLAELVDLLSKEYTWSTKYCTLKNCIDEMEIAWIDHPEAILIKMADRLHNLKTIEGFTDPKQKRYIQETKTILIPSFKYILKNNNLGDYKDIIKNLLHKINKEVHKIEKKLSNK